jgi:toluene monooxygenase system ferredoxin subunit
MNRTEAWVYVASLDDLWEGEVASVSTDDAEVLLCNVGGDIFAYEDRCPHLANPLSKGELDAEILTCAAHEWVFDVRTGRGINPASACLRGFDVLVEGDHIFVNTGTRES